MIEEPELSMKLKTYNVVLRINTLEDEKQRAKARNELSAMGIKITAF
jgi:hypothetical protein